MIRCAVDAREFTQANRLTGVGRFLTNIVAPLGTRPDEFEFILFARSLEAVPDRLKGLPGVRLEVLPAARNPAFREQVILPRQVREAAADCFFSPWHKGPMMPGVPLVITVHDIAFLRMPELVPWQRFIARWRLRNMIRRSRKVITVSKFTERDLVDMFPQAAEKTTVMYSDIGADWHRMLTTRDTGLPPTVSPMPYGKFFLYVGAFKPHKNVDLLIKGFATGVTEGNIPRHNLVLVGGDDENLGRIKRLIERLGMESRVQILRDMDDHSLSRFYRAADWFVTASQYEGYGYPPVEAMIAGCPVICHPATSLLEVVGSAAFPIPVLSEQEIAATLVRAVRLNPAQRADYIAAGSRQCRLFSPGQTAEAFARLIRSLVEPAPDFSVGRG